MCHEGGRRVPGYALAHRGLARALVLVVLLAGSSLPGALASRSPRAATNDTDRVLVLMRSGLERLRAGDLEASKDRFDEVLLRIERYYVDTEAAARARSLWYEEGSKTFLGEPYERVMAYFYRGVLHLLQGELEDARVAFKAAMLQDAFAEEKQYRCDFSVLPYLYGLVSRAIGDSVSVEDSLKELRTLLPNRTIRYHRSTRYLLIVEVGTAPRKIADGLGHAALKYARGRNRRATAAVLERGSSRREPELFEDLFFQAATRGGRAVDRILEGKLIFQEDVARSGRRTSGAGDAASLAGAVMRNSGCVELGGGAMILGGVAQLIAARARPHADTRYWDNLPEKILVFELPASARRSPYTLVYLDDLGREVERRVLAPLRECPEGSLCTIYVPSPAYGNREIIQ